MVLWPVVNPGGSNRGLQSRTTPPITADVGLPAVLTHSAPAAESFPHPVYWKYLSQDQLLLLRKAQRVFFSCFFFLLPCHKHEPMLLESCLKQHSVVANRAAAGSWAGGRGVWALVQHDSGGLLGTSPHHLVQLLSQLCQGTTARNWRYPYICPPLNHFFAGWHLCRHPTFRSIHPALPASGSWEHILRFAATLVDFARTRPAGVVSRLEPELDHRSQGWCFDCCQLPHSE